MQHLQYGNYDIRYMVYVRRMADIKATYRFLISTRYFAHLDGLSAENMIPHLLSFAISI